MLKKQWDGIIVGDDAQIVSKNQTGAFAYIVEGLIKKKTKEKIFFDNGEIVLKEDYLLSQKRKNKKIFKSKTKAFSPWKGDWPQKAE